MNRYTRLARLLDRAFEMYAYKSRRDHALAIVALVKRQVSKRGSCPYGVRIRLARFN